MKYSKVNFIMDAYYGSSAKAISSAYLTKKWLDDHEDANIALISINGASSSHTYKLHKDSEPFVFKALPSGAGLNREPEYKNRITVFIAPSAIIDPKQLLREIEYCELLPEQVIVSDRSSVLDSIKHPKAEAQLQGSKNHLGSTHSGQSASYVDKISRSTTNVYKFHQNPLYYTNMDYPQFPQSIIKFLESSNKNSALVEIPQGFPLSLDYSIELFKSTFRNLNPLQVMSDLGLNAKYFGQTYANFRALPIRVSNRFDLERVIFEVVTSSDGKITKKKNAKDLGFDYDITNSIIQPILDAKEHGNLVKVSPDLGQVHEVTRDQVDNIVTIKDVLYYEGTSGKFHPDMEEISWKQLSKKLGYEVNEKTTLTRLTRRLAVIKDNKAISEAILEELKMTINPDYAIVTFTNYWGEEEANKLATANKQLEQFGIELIAFENGDSVDDVHDIDLVN